MIMNIYLFSVIFSIMFLLIVVELVRKNRLSEKYSLLWIFFGVVILMLSVSPVSIEKISMLINVKYAPSVLFVFGLLFLILYSLQITIVISNQSKRIIRLTQEITLMKEKLNENHIVDTLGNNSLSNAEQADNEAV